MAFDFNKHAPSIQSAIAAGGNIWENLILSDFKSELKTYYRTKLNEQCCYCRKNTDGEFKMVLDIEHVLPKSVFRTQMFTLYNLSVSCKRCNMLIKKEDYSFVTDEAAARVDGNYSHLYTIIHPNLDDYFAHLTYHTETVNDKKIVKYQVVADSQKGQCTYEYFNLSELEVDTLNQAQGLKAKEELDPIIDPQIAKQIEDLLKNI